ncbi:hypothetical protein TNCV_2173891 [Trichonephila clavipes]|nr:hypothetical protein TNCV_2173891 [Trichonephila clavipes]
MPRGRHRACFDQVSEFDEGRMVAYTDGGLSFREIDQRVGRNQATVMHRWIQEIHVFYRNMADRSYLVA